MSNYDLENFKYYNLYDASYNAEGMNLKDIDEEIKRLRDFYPSVIKKDKPIISRIIKELEFDKQRIENYANNKSTHLVGFCSFSNEIFQLARRLARTKDEKKRDATKAEIATLINNLDDEEFVKSHKTTKIIALRRIGILMTTEENELVLKELKENLYHIPEIKQGFLNPHKYYEKINNRDSRLSKKPEAFTIF